MTPQEIVQIIDEHERWLRQGQGGVRANLSRANLQGFTLTDVNLRSCIAPGSLDTSLSHAAGLSDIAVCHA